MPTITPTTPRAPIHEAAAPAVPGQGNGDPAGFASLLRQSRLTTPAQPSSHGGAPTATGLAGPPAATDDTAPPPAESADGAADGETAPAASGTNSPRATAKNRTAAERRASAGTIAAPTPETTTPAADTDPDAKPHETPATTPSIDPTVMHWLAGLQRQGAEPARSATAPAGHGHDAPAATGTDAIATDPRADARGRDPRGDVGVVDARTSDAAAFGAKVAEATSNAAAALAATLANAPATADPSAPAPLPGADAAAAAAAAFGSAPPTPTATPTAPVAVAVAIAAAPGAPDFAQEMGLRLGVLARDGVQHAELHLNPAEMGPVSVQIVLDGTQARIDFGAEHAATRQAIEAGLPALAGALQDAGFTLAGGGVSDHAGRGEGGPGGGDRRGDRGAGTPVPVADALQPIPTATRRFASAGGLDVFA